MALYFIDTVSQEQTDFVCEYLNKTTEFNLKNPKRYIGFSDFRGMGACHSNSPHSEVGCWSGYKKISVDELFAILSNKVKIGDRIILSESGDLHRVVKHGDGLNLLNEETNTLIYHWCSEEEFQNKMRMLDVRC